METYYFVPLKGPDAQKLFEIQAEPSELRMPRKPSYDDESKKLQQWASECSNHYENLFKRGYLRIGVLSWDGKNDLEPDDVVFRRVAKQIIVRNAQGGIIASDIGALVEQAISLGAV